MACPTCNHQCGTDNSTSFGMYFRDVEETFAILPCNDVQKFSQHFTSGTLKFKAHGHRYAMDVYRGHDKSIITGVGFNKFKNDFKLGSGQYVLFVMAGRMPKAYVNQFNSANFLDEEDEVPTDSEVEEEQQGEPFMPFHTSADDNSDVEDQHQNYPDITYSRDTTLVDNEKSRLGVILSIGEPYTGSRFVHRFTPTNLTNKSMKIPNKVSESLNIGKVGVADLQLGEGEVYTTAFKTDNDGRMVFNKEWGVFANKFNFQVGDASLFTFQMSNNKNVDVICVVDILSI